VRGETGDQTGQESRSAGHGAARSVTAMDITIQSSFLPHNDPDASLAFYRDTLGFAVTAPWVAETRSLIRFNTPDRGPNATKGSDAL
jgi:Glyoxalase/Bleomycin resistance protein/Dioxygenase superfamily